MLILVPTYLDEAKAFVRLHHRHSLPPLGHRVSVGVEDDGQLVGVAIVGRPVAKIGNGREIAECLRCCTSGKRNACSKLYGAAKRLAAAMGYRRLITYTLEDEDGTSLKAAGFARVALVKGRQWSRPSRPRKLAPETPNRWRWEVAL